MAATKKIPQDHKAKASSKVHVEFDGATYEVQSMDRPTRAMVKAMQGFEDADGLTAAGLLFDLIEAGGVDPDAWDAVEAGEFIAAWQEASGTTAGE